MVENGKLCPEGGYFLFYIGEETIILAPEYVPGEWIFRCSFGYHYIYRFENPQEFFCSYGDPPYDVYVQCFNAGEDRIPQYGEGDDIPSNIVSWRIVD